MSSIEHGVDAGVARGELTIRQLTHFVAAAETGTISGAAARLRFSASAVSASITELERALETKLCVRRRAQGLTLTSAGDLVLTKAKRLLADVAELTYSVRGEDAGLVGPLIVGCFVTLAPSLLPRLLDEFAELHPHVSTDFVVETQNELPARLRSGEIDAAIMYDMGELEGIDRFVLYEGVGYALFGERHPLARHETVTLEEVVDLPFVLFDQTPSARYAMRMFEARGLVPNVRHKTHSFELTRSIVARSDSVYAVLVQRPVNKRSYEDLPVFEKDILPQPPSVPVVFAWARDVQPSPRVRALADLVHQQYPGPSLQR